MKRLLFVIVAAALMLPAITSNAAVVAAVERYHTKSLLPAATATVTGNTTTTLANQPTFELWKEAQVVSVDVEFVLSGAGVGNVTFIFQHSMDGITWHDVSTGINVSATGTTVVKSRIKPHASDQTVYSTSKFVRLKSVGSANAGVNVTVSRVQAGSWTIVAR